MDDNSESHRLPKMRFYVIYNNTQNIMDITTIIKKFEVNGKINFFVFNFLTRPVTNSHLTLTNLLYISRYIFLVNIFVILARLSINLCS